MMRYRDIDGKPVRVTVGGKVRSGVISGMVTSSDGVVTSYQVRYTDIEPPPHLLVINNVEYPEGYSAYFKVEDVEFVEESN